MVIIIKKIIKSLIKYSEDKRYFIGENCVVEDDVEIGDYTYTNSNCYIENAIIGKFCSIGPSVRIGPINHDYHRVTSHPFLFESRYGFKVDKTLNFPKSKVYIGNDVWIGANVIICQGCTIGNGVVVAAGSVVTKNIPSYQIWGGIPARYIKDRFNVNIADAIEKTEWWNWSDDKLNRNIKKFSNPKDFLSNNAINNNPNI